MKSALKLFALVGLAYFIAVPAASGATTLGVSPSPTFDSGIPKSIKFRVQSDLKISIDLKVGENQTTLQPGQTIDVRLPVGTQITVATAVAGHPVGEVIVRVEPLLYDAIVHIKS